MKEVLKPRGQVLKCKLYFKFEFQGKLIKQMPALSKQFCPSLANLLKTGLACFFHSINI